MSMWRALAGRWWVCGRQVVGMWQACCVCLGSSLIQCCLLQDVIQKSMFTEFGMEDGFGISAYYKDAIRGVRSGIVNLSSHGATPNSPVMVIHPCLTSTPVPRMYPNIPPRMEH